MRYKPYCLLVFAMLVIVWQSTPVSALAEDTCHITVTTILAAHDDTAIDSRLKPQIGELQSMFNYTSYRLIGSESLTLNVGQSGKVSLPGEHQLDITPRNTHGNRADIALQMVKRKQTVFETQIQLLNRGSLFVGGPKYLNGNLIFKISCSY